jgi:hypothetical protein
LPSGQFTWENKKIFRQYALLNHAPKKYEIEEIPEEKE